jgi:pimeloyl-ACP methyl ester carboxylesterase
VTDKRTAKLDFSDGASDGRAMRVVRGVGFAAGTVAGLAAAAYAVERAVVAGVRRRPDADAGKPLIPPFDEAVRYPSHDGGSVYTISRGKGPTLLFSHGVTLSTRVWVKQFEQLPEQGFRCIAFDHRGHGESRCGDTGHSIVNLAEDMRTVLERMDLHDVVLVGHSMGGIAAQAFASRFPDLAAERVRGMVLMSTLAKTYLSGAHWLRSLLERLTGGGPSAGELMSRRNLGFFLARVGFGRDPQASHVEMVREIIAACEKEHSQAAIGTLVGLDMTRDVSNIKLPTLILSGSADVIAPSAESRRLADLIPDARLEVFEGAGHMLMLERTDDVHALITEFARDVGARRRLRRLWSRRPRRRASRWRAARRRSAPRPAREAAS